MRELRHVPYASQATTSVMTSTADKHEDRRAAPWLRWGARAGIVAEGTIYLLIGGLALAGAFDPTQHPSGSTGAMSKLGDAPLGHVMLGLLGLGLLAFVLWQLVLAVLDPECRDGRWSIKQIALRIHHFWSAALHCVLVGIAVLQMFDVGQTGSNGQTGRNLAAIALGLPGGRWLVTGIGVGVIAFALVQLILACRPQKDTRMELDGTSLRLPILILLALGYIARGALFGLIGAFLIHAGWTHDPQQVAGISGALEAIHKQAYGPWLLGTVAIGLIAFGLAQVAKARYREIRIG